MLRVWLRFGGESESGAARSKNIGATAYWNRRGMSSHGKTDISLISLSASFAAPNGSFVAPSE